MSEEKMGLPIWSKETTSKVIKMSDAPTSKHDCRNCPLFEQCKNCPLLYPCSACKDIGCSVFSECERLGCPILRENMELDDLLF